ncbi:hypothetical protein BG004_000946 [Podila humilis]|nr:hypothetical protein BG004_000946 [Podila humilis]
MESFRITSKKVLTLVMVIDKDNQKPGETVHQGALRELKEEAGITVQGDKLQKAGILMFLFENDPMALETHVYKAFEYTGQIQECDEMRPAWFDFKDIPYEQMWEDDKIWLPNVLDGQDPFFGRMYFKRKPLDEELTQGEQEQEQEEKEKEKTLTISKVSATMTLTTFTTAQPKNGPFQMFDHQMELNLAQVPKAIALNGTIAAYEVPISDDSAHAGPHKPMVRVPVVNGEVVLEQSTAKNDDNVRITAPFVELDHQAELDAIRLNNDPHYNSGTLLVSHSKDNEDEEKGASSAIQDRHIKPAAAGVVEEQVKKSHQHNSWFEFLGGMDSDSGVLVAYKDSTEPIQVIGKKKSKDNEKEEVEDTSTPQNTIPPSSHEFTSAQSQQQQQQQRQRQQQQRQHQLLKDVNNENRNHGASIEINRTPLIGQEDVLKSRLNKNKDHYDREEDDEDEDEEDRDLQQTEHKTKFRKGVLGLGKHHHHHLTSKKSPELEESPNEEYDTQQQKQPPPQQQQQNHFQRPNTSDTESVLVESTLVQAAASIPDSIVRRGLTPTVHGAHHCTPQFCVNTTVSADGRFATFHIERDLDATGWISLGIGYAMTMADLIILWPNPTKDNPRGAVLSRRTSHAYVEPHLVGQAHPERDGIKADKISEVVDLYPPNEYTLHNTLDSEGGGGGGGGTNNIFLDTKKFIVQFTRPIKTKNLQFKLTPGEEQDFCWAYSPRPISPDSISDPGAHISQHVSVGSFSMDVAANQPELSKILTELKIQDMKEEKEEKRQKALDMERENRKSADEAKEEEEKAAEKEKKKKTGDNISGQDMPSSSSSSSSTSTILFQGLSCLTALAVLYLFR